MKSLLKIPKYLKKPILLSFFICAATILGIFTVYFNLQPEVPLFYSLARPAQHLVEKKWLFLIPFISLIIGFSHLMIIQMSKQANRLLLKIFAWTTVGIQLILGLSLLRIIIIIK